MTLIIVDEVIKFMWRKIKINVLSYMPKKSLASSSLWVLFCRLIGMLFGYLFIFLLSKEYGVEVLGNYTLAFTILQILMVFGNLGIENASIKKGAELLKQQQSSYTSYLNSALLINLLTSFFIALVLILFGDIIAINLFNKPSLIESIFFISFLIIPYSFFFTLTHFFLGLNYIIKYGVLFNVIFNIIPVFLLFFTLLFDLPLMPIEILGVSIIISCVLAFYVAFRFKIYFLFSKRKFYSFSALLKLSIPMFLTRISHHLTLWSDTIMLGILGTIYDVGIYAVVVKLARLLFVIPGTIGTVTSRDIASLFAEKKLDELKFVMRNATRLMVGISAPLFIIMILFPEYILTFFGNDFVSGTIALIVLVVAQFVSVLFGPSDYLLNMTNKQIIIQNITIFSALVNIILNFFLIPLHGFLGAAIASSISILLHKVLSFLFARYYFNINFFTVKV